MLDGFEELQNAAQNVKLVEELGKDAGVELILKPYEELKSVEDSLRADFNASLLMPYETTYNHLFKIYLREKDHTSFADFFDAIYPAYASCSQTKRKQTAKEIFDEYIGKHTAAPAPAGDSAELPGQAGSEDGAPAGPVVFGAWLKAAHADTVTNTEKQLATAPLELWAPILKHMEAYFDKSELAKNFLATEHFKYQVQLTDYSTKSLSYDSFDHFRTLGRGAFGAVSAARRLDTGSIYAIKQMDKTMVQKDRGEKMVLLEKEVLSAMKSNFVLHLDFSFQDDAKLYLGFKMLTGGDLSIQLANNEYKGLGEERVRLYGAEVLLGLMHMHSHDFLYLDLKPANILIDEHGHAMISDLGLAHKYTKDLKCSSGTPGYWAPEIVLYTGTHFTTDFWSLGVFLWELMMGSCPVVKCEAGKEWSPFNSNDEEYIKTIPPKNIEEYPAELGEDLIDLLKKLFEMDMEKRLGFNGAQELQNHPFFSKIDWDAALFWETEPAYVPDKREVNTESLKDVFETDMTAYKDVVLTDDFKNKFKDFGSSDPAATQKSMVEALLKLKEQEEEGRGSKKKRAKKHSSVSGGAAGAAGGGGGCCTIS